MGSPMKLSVDRSDLEKVFDVLQVAELHHRQRDMSNGALHLAKETRYSPLTSELSAAVDRLRAILDSESPGREGNQA